MVAEFTLPCWTLSIHWLCYLVQCLIGTLLLRVIVFLFRAAAVVRGDFPDSSLEPRKHFWLAFRECFWGFSRNKAHADLGLNAFIGFFELAAYPVLFILGRFDI